jgi:hypothetical protein
MRYRIMFLVLALLMLAIAFNPVALAQQVRRTITVIYNSVNLRVNGTLIKADNILYNGTTYVPLRAVADALNKDVGWEQSTMTASINDRAEDQQPCVVESRIDGNFEGWSGNTTFRLINGQVWQQTSFGFLFHFAARPEVVIYRVESVYKMRVDGVKGSITVKQVK